MAGLLSEGEETISAVEAELRAKPVPTLVIRAETGVCFGKGWHHARSATCEYNQKHYCPAMPWTHPVGPAGLGGV